MLICGAADRNRLGHGLWAVCPQARDRLALISECEAVQTTEVNPQPEAENASRPENSADRSVEAQDGTIQALYGVALKIENSIDLVDEEPQSAKAELETAITTLNSLIRETRNRIFDLRPVDSERQDLADAISQLLRELSLNTLIGVALTIPPGQEGAWQVLSAQQRRALVEVARCALANVREHSRARHVRVDLAARGGKFIMRIDDDGRGMDVSRIPARPGGLTEMRELAISCGGDLRLASTPGEGTSVQVDMPLEGSQ